jgi:hypothetical protein
VECDRISERYVHEERDGSIYGGVFGNLELVNEEIQERLPQAEASTSDRRDGQLESIGTFQAAPLTSS